MEFCFGAERQGLSAGSRSIIRILAGTLLLLGLLHSSLLHAQTPVPVTSNGTPAESFLGEQFCFDAQFTNVGNPGFGPYMQLVIPADLSFNTATIFGSSAIITVVPGTFPAPTGNQLIDPVIGLPVTGPEDGTLTIIQLPVGSVVTGGPTLTTNICLTILPSAVAGVALDVTLIPVYEFGDTATGENGPIIGTANTQPVIPIIIEFKKNNGAPDVERPPSTTWPFTYTLTADIANTVTVTNLEFSDVLPGDLQYVGPVTITGGVGCVATTTPSTITPGGTLEVDCTSATGTTSDSDVTVSYPVYITDILDENSCGTLSRTNNATLDVDYLTLPQSQLTADSAVTVKHVALQKGAAPEGFAPGDTISYSLDFQVTDLADVSALVLTDTLPDGTAWLAHGALVIAGTTTPITPSVTPNVNGTTTVVYDIGAVAPSQLINAGSAISLSYTAVVQQTYVNTGDPVLASDSLKNTVNAVYDLVEGISIDKEGSLDLGADGVPTVGDVISYTFDVSNSGNVTLTSVAVTDPMTGLSAISCDWPGSSDVTTPAGTMSVGETVDCTATYPITQADIDAGERVNTATATGTPDSGPLVTDNDSNTVAIPGTPVPAPGTIVDRALGATACDEGSDASVGIKPVSMTKSIVNPQPYYVPGETVTFRLNLQVPSGDTSDVQFSDALPLPVFNVADISTGWNVDVRPGPNDSLGLTPDNITTFPATNTIVIDWPDISTASPAVLEVDIDALVTDDPYADGLFLTNIAQSSTENTPGNQSVLVAPVQLLVGAPALVMTKGISASTNPNSVIIPPPGTLPVDGDITNSDAQDVLTYVLTVENIGSASAFDVQVSDTVLAGLTACSLPSVEDGNGAALAYTGDLFTGGLDLTAALTGNDGNPSGGGAPYGTDTAIITFNCTIDATVQPQQVIDNEAGVVWASQPGAVLFPEVTDNATATAANVNASKLFVATSEATTDDNATPPRATIGEIVRYRIVAELPEGTINVLNLSDVLPGGLTFLDDSTAKAAFISNGAPLSSSTVAGIPTIVGNDPSLAAVPSTSVVFVLPDTAISGGPFGNGDDPAFGLGEVTNSDNDDADAEFLIIEFNALVNNSTAGSNDASDNLDNSFNILNGADNLDASNSVQVLIAEPAVTIEKTADPTSGDAGDVIGFELVLANPTGGNVSGAFDVLVTDTLPAGLISLSVPSITPVACPGLGEVSSSTLAMLDLFFDEMAPGCTVTVEYTAVLDAAVAPGTSITNTAAVSWTSLPGPNGTTAPPDNPTGSVTPGASGTDTGERNDSGGHNDYTQSDDATVAIQGVALSKAVETTSQTSTGSEQFRPLLDDLTIGETADFLIIATIPEGTTPQVVISDTMPFTNGVMEMLSATVVSVGANLTPGLMPPSPAILLDSQLADGINDSASFDFGQVVNMADGVSDVKDQITLRVTGLLRDLAVNVSGDLLTNTALVQFGPGLDASANAQVDVVAPVLNIVKTGNSTQGDAGDLLIFTLTVDHAMLASTAVAFDALLTDTLPAGLTLVPMTLTQVSGPPADDLDEVGNGIEVSWASFGLTDSAVLSFQATIDTTVMPGQLITNTATVNWSSLPDGDPNGRMGSANNGHGITITEPGLVKEITETSEDDTGTGQFGPETDLTIGENVTYQFTVVFPEGTTNSAVVRDQLPIASSVLQVVSSRIVSIGGNISGTGLPAEETSGVASDTNADTFNDRVEWTLGDLQNAPDGADSADDEILFEVIAVVLDQAANQSGVVTQTNTASLVTATSGASGTVDVDLVAPAVTLEKVITSPAGGFVDAGDTVTQLLTIDHAAISTADAYNLIVTDTLPSPGLEWVGDGTVVSDCPGLIIDSISEPVIVFTIPQLDLLTDNCTISYDTLVENSVQPSQTLTNGAVMDYDSTPVFVAGETRRLSDSDTAEVTVLAPTLVKVTTVSNVEDTGMIQYDSTLPDLAIGETITYELTIVVPEGTLDNAIVTDLMPVLPPGMGFMEAIGASVSEVGVNISTSLPGIPVLDDFQVVDGLDDRIVFDFGTILNLPDGINNINDRIVMQVVGRVADVADNADGDLLVNNASFDFTGGSLADDADVEVVEPELNLTKDMGPVIDATVRFTLTVENTGTAPAYDINVSDVLEDSIWSSAALSQVSVSSGFLLQTVAGPGAGQTTVTFSSDPLAVSPAGTIPVNSSVTAVFDIPLAALPPVPNPIPNQADLDQADTLPGNDPAARGLPPDSDTAQIGIPDLQVSKSAALQVDADTSTDVSPGDTLRYTLVIANNGAGDATNVLLDDIPDANTALVVGSVTTSQGSVIIGNGAGDATVQVSVGTIVATASVTVTYDVVIDQPLPAGVNELVNQAVVTSTELPPVDSDDPAPPGDEDPTVVPVNGAPDLVLNKDDGGVTAMPGDTVSYSLTYQNVGNQDATGVVITETVPAHTTFNAGASTAGWACVPDGMAGSTCTLAVGSVAAGAAAVMVTFAVGVDNPLAAGVEQVANSASIADDGSNGLDPTPGDNGDSDTTPVDALPDLVLNKDDGDATAMPGDTVSYSLTYQNVGNQDATGVVITETVPAHTTFNAGASTAGWACVPDGMAGSTCTLAVGSVAAGAAAVMVTFAVDVDNPLAAGVEQVANSASIADDGSNGLDPTPGDNGDSDTTPVDAVPDLVLNKDDGDATAMPGDTVSYSLTYQNVGNQDATGVVITETVPAHTTFNAGASTADWTCVPDGMAGSTCTLAVGSVAAGAAAVMVTFAVDVDNPLAAGVEQVANSASIADDGSNGLDPTPGDNGDSDTTPVDAVPDLVISKDDGGATATPGDTVSYALTYQNVGNQDATGVVITETVPAHTAFNAGASTAGWVCVPDGMAGSTCTLAVGSVAAGAAAVMVTFAVDVDNPLAAGVEQVANSASIADDGSNGLDPTPGDNGDSDTTPVDAVPDLVISKDDGGATATPGDTVSYSLTYQNVGNQDATGVVITETVPAHTTFNAGASTADWACVPDGMAGSTCTLAVGSVAAGAAAVMVTFAVDVDNPLAAGVEQVANSASIADDGSNGLDPTPGDNGDSDTTPVDAVPDLVISKDDGGATATPGDTVSYSLTYQNVGNQDATGVVITETVPAHTTFNAGASTAGWVCVPDGMAGSTCTLTIGNLAAGAAAAAVTFAVDLDDPWPFEVMEVVNAVNIADDGSNGPDPTPDNNDDGDTTPVGAPTTFRVTKQFTDGNLMDVEVRINCNTGLPLSQSREINENEDITFVMTSFTPGELDCDIEEVVPEGYSPSYEASATESGFALSISDDAAGCHFEGIGFGGFVCNIVNTPGPVDIEIEKNWVIAGMSDNYFETDYRLTLYCDGEIIDGDDDCGEPFSKQRGQDSPSSDGWCRSFTGDSSDIFTAQVIPEYPSTQCTVVEKVYSDAVEVDNGCEDLEVSAGQGASCLITNIVFFEGIPTLNQYGMAILALLMLGIGFVGFRRFV